METKKERDPLTSQSMLQYPNMKLRFKYRAGGMHSYSLFWKLAWQIVRTVWNLLGRFFFWGGRVLLAQAFTIFPAWSSRGIPVSWGFITITIILVLYPFFSLYFHFSFSESLICFSKSYFISNLFLANPLSQWFNSQNDEYTYLCSCQVGCIGARS